MQHLHTIPPIDSSQDFLKPNLTNLFFSDLNLKTPSIRQAFCVDMSGIDIDKWWSATWEITVLYVMLRGNPQITKIRDRPQMT